MDVVFFTLKGLYHELDFSTLRINGGESKNSQNFSLHIQVFSKSKSWKLDRNRGEFAENLLDG